MVKSLVMNKQPLYGDEEREAIYRIIASRRDVRSGFITTPLPEDLLLRLLSAAHCAPSVGLMQPSRFIVIRDLDVRTKVHDIFQDSNAQALASYQGEQRDQYVALKLEGILEAPQNLCVLCDPTSMRGHKLGRHTMPETAVYSTVCAIQNLWLAARAEGVGVGWVSILDPSRLRAVLNIPEHMIPVAYLCLGYVNHFASKPELERFGWESRVPLEQVISYDQYTETDKS
jgi:5,6-dimethylbenzimidazole synthase